MKTKTFADAQSGDYGVTLTVSAMELHESTRLIYERMIDLVAVELAKRIIAEHGQEILAKCDMQAVANLSIAEAANGVRETIHRKLPDVVRVETEVYQRGILGGMKRIL